MTTLQRVTYKTWFALAGASLPGMALAAPFGGTNGGGLEELPDGGTSLDVRALVLEILTWVLNLLALLAVIYIIVAGIRLIVSQGDDDQKGKAKKTIMFVIVGLIVIILARVIVGFVISEVPNIIN